MPLRHRPATRWALSALVVANFGAIAVYILPAGTPDIPYVPEPVEEAVGGAVGPAVRAAWPLARRWLDVTATRQHWNLFAPFPSEWTTSLEVVAWSPSLPDSRSEAAGPAGPVDWAADTITVQGPVQASYPHWTRHRAYRVVFNMGYPGWGDFVRPVYAAWMCRRLRERNGRAPDGLTLTAVWERVVIPWRDEGPEPEVYRQFLGGFTCAPALGEALPPYLKAVPADPAPGDGGARPGTAGEAGP